jgi:hypothetical protein
MGEPSNATRDEEAWEDVDGLCLAPPGEEGMFISNAGGEDAVFHEIIDYVAPKKYIMAFFICR